MPASQCQDLADLVAKFSCIAVAIGGSLIRWPPPLFCPKPRSPSAGRPRASKCCRGEEWKGNDGKERQREAQGFSTARPNKLRQVLELGRFQLLHQPDVGVPPPTLSVYRGLSQPRPGYLHRRLQIRAHTSPCELLLTMKIDLKMDDAKRHRQCVSLLVSFVLLLLF